MVLSALEENDVANADAMTLTIVARNPTGAFDDDQQLAEPCFVAVDHSTGLETKEISVRFSGPLRQRRCNRTPR